MSQLSDKISSYSIERGIEFDGPVSGSITQTGSITPTSLGMINAANISYESTVGPIGGSGSWLYNIVSGTASPRLGVGSTDYSSYADNDLSLGFWFKLNSFLTGTGTHILFSAVPTGSTNPGFNFAIGASSRATNPNKLLFTQSNVASFAPISDTLQTGIWYYVAYVRKNPSPNNVKIYLNNVLRTTLSVNNTTVAITQANHGSSLKATGSFTYNYSNFYSAPTSVIDSTQIAEIWTAGSTASQNLKYWNGSAWTVPTNKYQWDGTNWVTMNGTYWNGTTWTEIT